jgi:hypothetical protein
MIPSKDDKEFKWIWVDGKMHTLSLDHEDEKIDIKELHKVANDIVTDKEELCKSIYFLGVCLTGTSESAWGFLMGYLVRSIKKDKPWNIVHQEEETSKEERNNHIADAFENVAKMIREGKIDEQVSTPNVGGDNGTDLFTKT